MVSQNVDSNSRLFLFDLCIFDLFTVLAPITMKHFILRFSLPIDCDDFDVEKPFIVSRN